MTTTLLAVTTTSAILAATLLALDRRRMARHAAGTEEGLRRELSAAQTRVRTEEQTLEAVRALASEAIAEQSRQLVDLADAKYQTLEQSAEARWTAQGRIVLGRLEQYAQHLQDLERERRDDSGALQHALAALKEQTAQVQAEAGNLAAALRDNATRGLWGEVQLRRALEASGMLPHADFLEQGSFRAGSTQLRPDVVVHLPNDRSVVIDAKAPLDAFLRAADAEGSEQRRTHLTEHGDAVARHVRALAKRDYADVVEGSIDFVVLFMPGDPYLSAAVEGRPALIEDAWGDGVLLVTPTTLIGLLRAVALGWRESRVTEQAQRIAELGRELHRRVATFAEHFGTVGTNLGRAVDAYNESLASLESRLLVTARRFDELGAGSGRELTSNEQLDARPRLAAAEELRGPHHAA